MCVKLYQNWSRTKISWNQIIFLLRYKWWNKLDMILPLFLSKFRTINTIKGKQGEGLPMHWVEYLARHDVITFHTDWFTYSPNYLEQWLVQNNHHNEASCTHTHTSVDSDYLNQAITTSPFPQPHCDHKWWNWMNSKINNFFHYHPLPFA